MTLKKRTGGRRWPACSKSAIFPPAVILQCLRSSQDTRPTSSTVDGTGTDGGGSALYDQGNAKMNGNTDACTNGSAQKAIAAGKDEAVTLAGSAEESSSNRDHRDIGTACSRRAFACASLGGVSLILRASRRLGLLKLLEGAGKCR